MISWESVLGGHAGKACVFCTASKSLVSCLYDILIWYMHTLFGLLESSYVSLLESFLYSLTWLVELLISALSSLSTNMAPFICLRISVFTCLPSFVSQSGWWCPAPPISVFTCLELSCSRAGGVRLSGSLSSLVSFHLSPKSVSRERERTLLVNLS